MDFTRLLKVAARKMCLPLALFTCLVLLLSSATVSAQTGLVGYWRFDEGAGNTVADSSGNSNGGSINNGPAWVEGKYGHALSFDGVDDYVAYPTLLPIGLSGLTVEAWINSSLDNAAVVVYHGDNGEFQLGSGLSETLEEPQRITFYVHLTDGNWYRAVSSPVTPNVWHKIAGAWSKGGTLRIYVDDVLAGETAVPDYYLLDPGENFLPSIGSYDRGADKCFNGTVDEVGIFDRALSQEEIQAGIVPPDRPPTAAIADFLAAILPIVVLALLILVPPLSMFFYVKWYYTSNKIFDSFVKPGIMQSKLKTLILVGAMLTTTLGFLFTVLQPMFYGTQQTDIWGIVTAGGFMTLGVFFLQIIFLLISPGLLLFGLVILWMVGYGWTNILGVLLFMTTLYFSATHAVDTLIERIDRAGYGQLAMEMRCRQRIGILGFIITIFKPLLFVEFFQRAKKEGTVDITTSFARVASIGDYETRRVEGTTVTLPPISSDQESQPSDLRERIYQDKRSEEVFRQMTGADFVGRLLTGERDFSNIELEEGFDLSGHGLFERLRRYLEQQDLQNNPVVISHSKLRYLNAEGLHLAFVKAVNANLEGAHFAGANLDGADFENAVLTNVDLSQSNLRNANLMNSDLSVADLRLADLENANLDGTQLIAADLRGAHNLEKVRGLSQAVCIGIRVTPSEKEMIEKAKGNQITGEEFDETP